MPRWLIALSFGGSVLAAFACNDDTVEFVEKDVCYSGMRWVGERRGSPEMFPGRDCVGCHIDNDGPPLALGGTVYSYVLGAPVIFDAQSGEDCFGVEGVQVVVEDGEGQILELTTNRAGNFYVEGNPDDFAKPFNVEIRWINGADGEERTRPMSTQPMYGGCARCHDPALPSATDQGLQFDAFPSDADYSNGTARIGLPGYTPSGPDALSVEDELRALAGEGDD